MLYQNLTEVSRIVEQVEITEEGMFAKEQVPDSYGGAKLTLEIVHQVKLADTSGRTQVLKFNNKVPLDNSKAESLAPIFLDGQEYRPGTGTTPRDWVTVVNTNMDEKQRLLADSVSAKMEADGGKTYI